MTLDKAQEIYDNELPEDDSETTCLRCDDDFAIPHEDYCQHCLDIKWNRSSIFQSEEGY